MRCEVVPATGLLQAHNNENGVKQTNVKGSEVVNYLILIWKSAIVSGFRGFFAGCEC